MTKRFIPFLLIITMLFSPCSYAQSEHTPNYSNIENWAYLEIYEDEPADVFFICPTVYGGSPDCFNMSLDDLNATESFIGATNMEKSIYDEECRFFAPYYRQAGLNVYELPEDEREQYLALAYKDVREAFLYYLEYYNEGQPIILAGFSQGADMGLRLLKDCFVDEEVNDLLVACYAVGWSISEEELEEYPHLRFASCANDTGVIVSFNSESEDVTDSIIVPAGERTLAINPLNWKTDGTIAEKDENLGACFTNYYGEIETEIPNLTGAYIDPLRGTLKVTDVTPEDYPPVLSIFESGVYHLYDYQFFYRNLQENVAVRLDSYLATHISYNNFAVLSK